MNFFWKQNLSTLLMALWMLPSFFILGCKTQTSQRTTGTNPTLQSQTFKSGLCYEIDIDFLKENSGPFEVINKPNWAEVDSEKGILKGCPSDPGLHSEIVFQADKSFTNFLGQSQLRKISSKPFTLEVLGDPLASASWHLQNKRQTSYALRTGSTGEDMKVHLAIQRGLTGKGVEIAVSDDGLDIRHEDLEDNILTGRSHNYNNETTDPTMPSPHQGEHGTSVAGIIAAVGWNGKGSRGIAPGSKIAGLNFLSASPSVYNYALLNQVSRDFHIVNQSWGLVLIPPPDEDDNSVFFPQIPNSDYVAQLKNAVETLRGGRGMLIVKSAGNSFPMNSGFDPDNRNPYTIVVGALAADGTRASYSSVGSNLWISGLAGERGFDSYSQSILGTNPASTIHQPAIITTDASGCGNGYSRNALRANDFQIQGNQISIGPAFFLSLFNFDVSQNRPHLDNPNCNYTNTFNGTSAAAPSISGVIALILEQNPNLTWRDIKHILASTADKVEPNSNLWIENKALGSKKYHFHPHYGFGRANAEAAVLMASDYQINLGTFESREMGEAVANPVPDFPNSNLSRSLSLQSPLLIEATEITVTITHPATQQLNIDIVSPSGTRSNLLHPSHFAGRTPDSPNLVDLTFLTNAFYGETSDGQWTIEITDTVTGQEGNLNSWSVKVSGRQP